MALAVLVVVAALVTPAFRASPPPASTDVVTQVIAKGRALAIRRGETLRLSVGPQGWVIRTEAQRGEGAPAEGAEWGNATREAAGIAPFELRLTPLGSCVVVGGSPPVAWDALRCAPAEHSSGSSQRTS